MLEIAATASFVREDKHEGEVTDCVAQFCWKAGVCVWASASSRGFLSLCAQLATHWQASDKRRCR